MYCSINSHLQSQRNGIEIKKLLHMKECYKTNSANTFIIIIWLHLTTNLYQEKLQKLSTFIIIIW